MLQDTLSRLESALTTLKTADPQKKAELLKLYASLKSEIEGLPRTHEEQARSIAGFAEIAVHEAARKSKSETLLKLSVEGLEASVQGFERSHPQLTETVNDLCILLARMGI